MKRSLYSVKDREVEYVEGRSSNSSSNSSQCALASKEHCERLRQAVNNSDLWNNFVKENWAPVLESAFGPDWGNKYPEEVTAILWWALNYRSRAHVGQVTTDVSSTQPGADMHNTQTPDAGAHSSTTKATDESSSSSSRFFFALEQAPEFVIGCNTPTSRTTSKDTVHAASPFPDTTPPSNASCTSFYLDHKVKSQTSPMRFPAPVAAVGGPVDMSFLEPSMPHSNLADVGDIMQQIQQELESRIMLCDVSLDMGVTGDMDLPEISPHELLERSGLTTLLPKSVTTSSCTSMPPPASSIPPNQATASTVALSDTNFEAPSQHTGLQIPSHVALIPTAPPLGLQHLAFSLSSSLSQIQDNLTDIASQYSSAAPSSSLTDCKPVLSTPAFTSIHHQAAAAPTAAASPTQPSTLKQFKHHLSPDSRTANHLDAQSAGPSTPSLGTANASHVTANANLASSTVMVNAHAGLGAAHSYSHSNSNECNPSWITLPPPVALTVSSTTLLDTPPAQQELSPGQQQTERAKEASVYHASASNPSSFNTSKASTTGQTDLQSSEHSHSIACSAHVVSATAGMGAAAAAHIAIPASVVPSSASVTMSTPHSSAASLISAFPVLSTSQNPFPPVSLGPAQNLFLDSSLTRHPTSSSSLLPSFTQSTGQSHPTIPIFTSLQAPSPTQSPIHPTAPPIPNSCLANPPALCHPSGTGAPPPFSSLPQASLPPFGLYIPTLTQNPLSQNASTSVPHGNNLHLSQPDPTTQSTATALTALPALNTQPAIFPASRIPLTCPPYSTNPSNSPTPQGLPRPSPAMCNMLYAMGNALALQYVPVQLIATGAATTTLPAAAAAAAAASSSTCTTPVSGPPVYLMDSLVSGHTFQSIVDGVDSSGRTPLHVAAAAGRADVVEQLMYVGCDCSKPLQADFPLDQKISHSGLQLLSEIHAALRSGETLRGVVPGYEQPPSFVGCTALHLAAYFGNLEVVDLLLKAPGVDIKATSAAGMTALHMAANQGHAHVLARLCKVAGAEVDVVDAMGCTALHHAAALGHAVVLDQLWPRGANLEALDPHLRTPLHLAAQAGHTDVVSKLVIAGCHVQKYSKGGLTAGHLAAMYGYSDVLEKLLLAGYEVDCPAGNTLPSGISGASPLHLAAAAGHMDLVTQLLNNGASVLKQDARGATALFFAAEGAQLVAFQTLLQAGSDIHTVDRQGATVLHAAAKGGNWAIIHSLLQLGCDASATTRNGENVLHYAAKAGATEACQRLLEFGADSSSLDATGNAPWHVAAMEGHQQVLELFLSQGVPLELPTLLGATALHCAAAGGHLEAVQVLLTQGAAPEATCTQQQQNSLHVAAKMDQLEVLQLLLGHVEQLHVNAQDTHGCTTLHYAAQKGNVEMLEILIAHGAEPNVSSQEGQTAMHYATKQQHLEAVECLLGHGCTAATQDVHGCNALHYAAQCAHMPLFRLLSQQPGTLVKEKALSGFTLLHYAVEGGSVEAVQMLLNADVWEIDDYQGLEGHNNALHMACKLGKLEIVKMLLLAGYSATARGAEGRQPLHWAAFGSRLVPANARKGADYYGVLQLLLVSGVDVHAIDEHHCNAVMYAAGSGEVPVLEQLLQLRCNPLLQDMTGWTALHWAATGENGSVIPMLLQLGCPLGALDQHGRLALHWAAEKGLMAAVTGLVDAMLEAGLDVHTLDGSGSSPAQLAACQGHVEVVAKLLETGKTKEVKGLTALHLAAQNGLDQVVAQLLAVAGCDVNVRDGDGLTPLHWAATRGALPVLQQLINGGADINAASNDGWMALHKAASHGHLAAVELLVSCGSVVNFKTTNGSTPLHYAASNGHAAVVAHLIAAGCPVNAKTTAGCTALYCAASAGFLEVSDELLKTNAEVDALTTTGCTALHIAASNGHPKVVQRLVAAGADMDIQASNGSCALHNAVQNGHVEVVEVLMAVGCDWDIQNSNGNTALHIAASKGNMDILNKLLGAGCDVHIKNSKQWQAVHSAANNGYFDVVLRLVQHGAAWKTKGDADVVRMLVRKSSLKLSYVEGRLRLAEREKQRLKKTPNHVAEHIPGSKPNDDELLQLSQQADANMAALLQEEEARREAQEAAAERRKAKKKSKKKKPPKDGTTKGNSGPSEGEADDADDEQGASDGRSLADEHQHTHMCQFDLELGSDTEQKLQRSLGQELHKSVSVDSSSSTETAIGKGARAEAAAALAAAVAVAVAVAQVGGSPSAKPPAHKRQASAGSFAQEKVNPAGERTNSSGGKNRFSGETANHAAGKIVSTMDKKGSAGDKTTRTSVKSAEKGNPSSVGAMSTAGDKTSLMQMIANLGISSPSGSAVPPSVAAAAFKPGTSAPGQYASSKEIQAQTEQLAKSLPSSQSKDKNKVPPADKILGKSKLANGPLHQGGLLLPTKSLKPLRPEPTSAKADASNVVSSTNSSGGTSAAPGTVAAVGASRASSTTTAAVPAPRAASAGTTAVTALKAGSTATLATPKNSSTNTVAAASRANNTNTAAAVVKAATALVHKLDSSTTSTTTSSSAGSKVTRPNPRQQQQQPPQNAEAKSMKTTIIERPGSAPAASNRANIAPTTQLGKSDDPGSKTSPKQAEPPSHAPPTNRNQAARPQAVAKPGSSTNRPITMAEKSSTSAFTRAAEAGGSAGQLRPSHTSSNSSTQESQVATATVAAATAAATAAVAAATASTSVPHRNEERSSNSEAFSNSRAAGLHTAMDGYGPTSVGVASTSHRSGDIERPGSSKVQRTSAALQEMDTGTARHAAAAAAGNMQRARSVDSAAQGSGKLAGMSPAAVVSGAQGHVAALKHPAGVNISSGQGAGTQDTGESSTARNNGPARNDWSARNDGSARKRAVSEDVNTAGQHGGPSGTCAQGRHANGNLAAGGSNSVSSSAVGASQSKREAPAAVGKRGASSSTTCTGPAPVIVPQSTALTKDALECTITTVSGSGPSKTTEQRQPPVAHDNSHSLSHNADALSQAILPSPSPPTSGTLSALAASFVPSSLSRPQPPSIPSTSSLPPSTCSTHADSTQAAAPAGPIPPLSYSAAVAPPGPNRTHTLSALHPIPSGPTPSHPQHPSSALSNPNPATSSTNPSLVQELIRSGPRPKPAWPTITSAAPAATATNHPKPSQQQQQLQQLANVSRTSSPGPCIIPPLSSSLTNSSIIAPPTTKLPSPTQLSTNTTIPTSTCGPIPTPSSLLQPATAASLSWGPVATALDPITSSILPGGMTSAPWCVPLALSHANVGIPRPMHMYLPTAPHPLDWSTGMMPMSTSRTATLPARQPIDWSFAPPMPGMPFQPSAPSIPVPPNQQPQAPTMDTATTSDTSKTSNSALHAASSPGSCRVLPPGIPSSGSLSWQLQPQLLRSHSTSGLASMGIADSSAPHSLPTPMHSSSIWSFNAPATGTGPFARPPGLSGGMLRPVARALFNEKFRDGTGGPEGSDTSDAGGNRGQAQFSPHVSDQYRCPISKKIMRDPVVAGDGYTYERSAIEEWLDKYDMSPITNSQFISKELVPNMTMRAAIQLLATQ